MKLKLHTKITLIYALVFTFILAAINGAVFLTMKFYSSYTDLMDIKNSSEIVYGILKDYEKDLNENKKKGLRTPPLTGEDFYERGLRYPIFVEVIMANTGRSEDRITSIGGMRITEDLRGNKVLELPQNGKVARQRIVMKIYEQIVDSHGVVINIGKSQEESIYNRKLMMITTSIASLIGMILSLVVASYLSTESFRPITNMRKSVESLSAENLHDRIQVPDSGDELTELGNTFNSLLDRLDTAYMRQSKFVSDASHELRTPLTVIKGFTDMLERWAKKDPEILDEAISAIKEETSNMSNLVENLLVIAKGENNKLSVNYEKFDLNDLVSEVTEETAMNAKDREITGEGIPCPIYADRKMIKQLLRIFIENSIKFTPDGGKIHVSLSTKDDKVVLKVWDNGDGISPKDITRIFERFYVADKARTKDKSGSGLGLSIAKWIVDVHNGKLSVESILGQFSEFIVELPLTGTVRSPDEIAKSHMIQNSEEQEKVFQRNEDGQAVIQSDGQEDIPRNFIEEHNLKEEFNIEKEL